MNRHPLVYLFLKLNIWLSFTSMLMVVATGMALSIPLEQIGIGVTLPALLFYFIYTEDRRDTSPEDHINQPYRTELVEKYQSQLLLTEIVTLGAYEGIVLYLINSTPTIGPLYFVLAQLPLAVLIAYDALKRYPTFDSLAVGSTWSFVIVFSVVISTAEPISLTHGVVFIAWLLIVMAGVESRNVQDIDGDNKSEKTTLAGYLGKQKTEYLNGTLKASAVVIFAVIAGLPTAGVVIVYLAFLQLFRELTKYVDTHTPQQEMVEGGITQDTKV